MQRNKKMQKGEGNNMEKRILVADDVAVQRELITRFLERICSMKVDLASNSAEEIEMARGTNYDLVISDNDCPKPNSGIYVIQEIRKFNPTVPIILFSGGLSKEAEAAARAAGATEIVEKPDYNALVQKAGKHLQEERK